MVIVFYLVYSIARNRFGSQRVEIGEEPLHAFNNAIRIIDWERALNLFHEQTLQAWFLDFTVFLQFWNTFYGTAHFVVTAVAFVWLYRARPGAVPALAQRARGHHRARHRRVLAVPVMPPRLLDSSDLYGGARFEVAQDIEPYGFVDTLKVEGGPWSFDSGAMQKLSNQYAAMPSLHIAWSVWCVLVMWQLTRSRLGPGPHRVLPVLHAVRHRGDGQPLLPRCCRWRADARPWVTSSGGRSTSGTSAGTAVTSTGRWTRLARRCSRSGHSGNVADRHVARDHPPARRPARARRSGARGAGWGDPRLHRRRPSPTTAGTSAPTSARSSSHWPCIASSTRRATPSCGTPATRRTCTRSSRAARPASRSSARPAGLSGYPSREESEHDFVENSHASTILSYAYGLAVARDSGADPGPAPHRRRHRRRLDDGRHGVRGAQQSRPLATAT